MLKRVVTAATAMSLAISPVFAQSRAAPAVAPEPATEQVEGSTLRAPGAPVAGGVFLIIVVLGVLLALGVLFDDDEGDPVTP